MQQNKNHQPSAHLHILKFQTDCVNFLAPQCGVVSIVFILLHRSHDVEKL